MIDMNRLTRDAILDPQDPMARRRVQLERARIFGNRHDVASPLAHDAVLDFVLAGNATVTLHSLKTNRHIAYRVRQHVRKEGRRVVERFQRWDVSVMVGSDNVSDFERLGLIDEDMIFDITNPAWSPEMAAPMAFAYMLRHALAYRKTPNLVVWHRGSCGHCGRDLTVPDSVERGIGPICAAKMSTSKRAHLQGGGADMAAGA